MIEGQLALIATALYTGAALYVNFVEHPARRGLDTPGYVIEWRRAYSRAFVMQLLLLALGCLLGLFAWTELGDMSFLIGALVLSFNLPYTLVVIAPINTRIQRIDPERASPECRALLERWGALHAVRTAVGFAAMLVFLQANLGIWP